MIYEFSYDERDQYLSVYEKMLGSRKKFFENYPEWSRAFHPCPVEDDYDRRCSPFYIVGLQDGGDAVASVRIMPTTGPTMLRDEFAPYFQGCPDIISSDIWELSYFSTTADTSSLAGRNLMLDVLKTVYARAFANGIKQIIGTYPRSKLRLYRRLECLPSPICEGEINGQEFGVGVWDVSPLALRHLAELQLRPF
ncbi:acyl-homoserine-lactone synthase [Acetobacter cerevisiae]|uniref:Acyl-homoserine-lactone synthase n=1 Tax=Acetobacter cerevisiae TaxID=178900 RepID=A0A149Q948_9PROT|nr:acyl-homoserine-lactone synthase [Acetobacter cerevisiae]KXU93881.1 hypothetical protein AD928_07880 [Acetobacter cerevisiae]GBQ07127.1 autoinducer synthesis protein [Acetobacter cerevisiae DSM 14362]